MNLYLAPVVISNTQLIDRIMETLQHTFKTYVNKISLSIDTDSLYSYERKQYFSTGFIEQSAAQTTHFNGKIIMITELDIYVPVLTFLFGEAQLKGKHSIISVCRLHEEFYSGVTNNELLYERAIKEVYHELGHNFGLIHCNDWDCVMHSSNSIEEVDLKGNTYCRNCFGLLSKSLL
ncbi:MAG: archemetzincin [Ignavibacteriae bacterium]|nr:MAG: archemetzincin [Ignavibacteriota bacterium]